MKCYMYKKKNSYKNLFFIFLFYNSLTAKQTRWKRIKKKKKAIFFQLETFVDKTINNF